MFLKHQRYIKKVYQNRDSRLNQECILHQQSIKKLKVLVDVKGIVLSRDDYWGWEDYINKVAIA